MDITDGMIEDAARLLAQEHGSDVFDVGHVPYEFTELEREQYRAEARAVAEFVAPLIAAQALRQAIEAVNRGAIADLIREHAEKTDLTAFPVAHQLAVDVLGLITRCPTCTGQTRETVGMVCQTCGTDYAPDAS